MNKIEVHREIEFPQWGINTASSICPQVIDLYWGVAEDEWDSPELQKMRMKLLEECLKTSAGPCFVVGIKTLMLSIRSRECESMCSLVGIRFVGFVLLLLVCLID